MFSKEKVNLGRQPELDLLKAFTVAFSMIIIHVYDWDTTLFDSGLVKVLDQVTGGIYGAPVFMFAMGMGLMYTRHRNAHDTAWRGLKLLAFGQALNLARYAVPFAIGTALGLRYTPVYHILDFSSDIMQFAGLAFLLIALTCKLKLKNWHTLILSMLLSVLGTALWYFDVATGNYFVDQFLGLFWGTMTESFFPLFNWFIYVAAGQWFAGIYQRVEDKTRFFLIFAPISAAIMAFYLGYQAVYGSTIFYTLDDDPSAFSWMYLPDSLTGILTFMFPLGFFYLLTRILPESLVKILSHPSKYINQYYSVSWVWIMVASLFVQVNTNEGLLFFWFNMLCCTILFVLAYNRWFVERVEGFCGRHAITLMVLVWVVSLGLAYYAYASYSVYPNFFNDYLLIQ